MTVAIVDILDNLTHEVDMSDLELIDLMDLSLDNDVSLFELVLCYQNS